MSCEYTKWKQTMSKGLQVETVTRGQKKTLSVTGDHQSVKSYCEYQEKSAKATGMQIFINVVDKDEFTRRVTVEVWKDGRSSN